MKLNHEMFMLKLNQEMFMLNQILVCESNEIKFNSEVPQITVFCDPSLHGTNVIGAHAQVLSHYQQKFRSNYFKIQENIQFPCVFTLRITYSFIEFYACSSQEKEFLLKCSISGVMARYSLLIFSCFLCADESDGDEQATISSGNSSQSITVSKCNAKDQRKRPAMQTCEAHQNAGAKLRRTDKTDSLKSKAKQKRLLVSEGVDHTP